MYLMAHHIMYRFPILSDKLWASLQVMPVMTNGVTITLPTDQVEAISYNSVSCSVYNE